MAVTFQSPNYDRHQWEERRRGRRYPCASHVAIGAQWVVGHDISRGGISAFMRQPLAIGHITTVSLGKPSQMAREMSGRAMVLRADPHPLGYLVALRFLDTAEPARRR